MSCPSRGVCFLHCPPSPYLSTQFLHLSGCFFHSMAVSGLIKIKMTHLATLTPPEEVKTVFKYTQFSLLYLGQVFSSQFTKEDFRNSLCLLLDSYLKGLFLSSLLQVLLVLKTSHPTHTQEPSDVPSGNTLHATRYHVSSVGLSANRI